MTAVTGIPIPAGGSSGSVDPIDLSRIVAPVTGTPILEGCTSGLRGGPRGAALVAGNPVPVETGSQSVGVGEFCSAFFFKRRRTCWGSCGVPSCPSSLVPHRVEEVLPTFVVGDLEEALQDRGNSERPGSSPSEVGDSDGLIFSSFLFVLEEAMASRTSSTRNKEVM